MKILHFSLNDWYVIWFKDSLIKYSKENLYKIICINTENNFLRLDNINYYDILICSWYDELNIIFNSNYINKIIVLDYHMLNNFNKYWYKLSEKIKNYENIEIHSPFIKFINEYTNYFYNDNWKLTWNFIKKIKWCHFPVDFKYIENKLKMNNSEKYIIIPWNHRRDYKLLFKSIKLVEEKNIIYKYKIYDSWITKKEIENYINIYNIKSNIFFWWTIEYTDFLNELYNSKFIILPLQNIKSICNGLTVYIISLACWKLTIVNKNETIEPFAKNWYNCLIWENEVDLAKYIIYALKNDDICGKIWKNGNKYVNNNCSFEKIISKLIN